jgi:hypothetical protein
VVAVEFQLFFLEQCDESLADIAEADDAKVIGLDKDVSEVEVALPSIVNALPSPKLWGGERQPASFRRILYPSGCGAHPFWWGWSQGSENSKFG